MKKGFTLIELLAVIVILAIIAVIAVPLIFGIIEKVKKSALGSTANGLMDSAEVYYTKNLEETGENKVFLFDDSRNGETVDGEKISYKGSFEGTGSVRLYSNGKTAICITDGKYYALKNVSDNEVKTGSGTCSYDSETESYLNINPVSQAQLDALQLEITSLQTQLNDKQLEINSLQDDLNNKQVNLLYSSCIGASASAGNWAIANNTYTVVNSGKIKILLWGQYNYSSILYKNGVAIATTPTLNQYLEFDVVAGDVIKYETKSTYGAGASYSYSYMNIISI